MITYLKNHQIDYDKWDDCIRQSFNGNAYAFGWYLDLVHDGWEALVEDDYKRVMPLTGSKKFGVTYLHQPFFTQQLGVFSKDKLNPKIVEAFLESIPVHYRFAEINLNSFNKVDENRYRVVLNKNHVLDLINPYEKLAKKYATNTRRNLKKGQSANLNLVKNIKPEELIRLFRENRGRDVKHWTDMHYKRLGRIMYSAIHKGRGRLYGVFTDHNELCAGAFFLKNANTLVFLFSGTSETARSNGAMTFLIDGVIREFANSKMVLDFEGSNDENLARFYRGFGAREVTYPGLRINRLRFPVKQVFALYKRWK